MYLKLKFEKYVGLCIMNALKMNAYFVKLLKGMQVSTRRNLHMIVSACGASTSAESGKFNMPSNTADYTPRAFQRVTMRPTFVSTDNLSEVSEAGTGRTGSTSERSGYSENREELLAFLGLQEDDQVFQERFRIDRKKLEEMIINDNDLLDSTTEFFQRVMESSETHIAWPSRLKIGAKSKKDPHVRIAGRCLQDVVKAKESIIAALGIRNKQVTMKLNVSYTHHSHIIGEGGQTITSVRRETGCHIHFPDSNRSGSETKSNQVSITGPMENVEKARARVRELVPLVFTFELQVVSTVAGIPDTSSPYVQQVSETYNVHVSCRTRSRLHATLVVVKGCEWEVERVKQATLLLMNHLCGKLASQIPVQMTMEISPHHHGIVLGPNSQYLRSIIEKTQTQIMFPDASDPNIPILKKSNITITGDINNVYLARQQLMGSLPISLTFNLNEDNVSVCSEKINQICDTLDVAISTRQCPKQNTISVIVKGVERNIAGVYEARRQLLQLEEKTEVDIPDTYFLPSPPKVFERNEVKENNSPRSLPTLLTPDALNNFNTFSHHDQSPIMLTPSFYGPMWGSTPPGFLTPLPWGRVILPQQGPTFPQPQRARGNANMTSRDLSSNSSGYGSQMSFSQYNNLSTSPVSESNPFSGLASLSSTASSMSPGVSPRNLSPTISGLDHQLSLDLATMMMKNSPDWSDHMNPMNLTPGDYEQRKYLALKALQNTPNSAETRLPTSSWSGYGFSLTSPSALCTDPKPLPNTDLYDTDPWKNSVDVTSPCSSTEADPGGSYLSSSNNVEAMSAGMLKRMQNSQADLPSLLITLGLDKYISLFQSQEIDMATFEVLTESNLKELGVHAYGARHKMLLAIAELRKRRSPISAAPGAERKRSFGWPAQQTD